MKKLFKPLKQQREKAKNSEYFRYRWFLTSSKKLVIGGKNSEQNEEIVSELIKSGKNYIVMHTKDPGSPFAVLQSDSYNEKDLEEMAIFTGCFSRAWREKKKEAIIDIFNASQIFKRKVMKPGTFGVAGEIKHKKVKLKLNLTKQNNVLRTVPFSVKEKYPICIMPGIINKETFAEQIAIKLEVVKEEVLQALPSGGFKLCN